MRWPETRAVVGLPACCAGAVAVALARFVERFEVAGNSMLPTLRPGDRLLVVRTRRLRPGDIAVVCDPRSTTRLVAKRVAEVSSPPAGEDGVVVLGDNPTASTDSRHYGPVPRRLIRGRAAYRYAPRDRTGAL